MFKKNIVINIVVLLAVLGAGAYFLMGPKKSSVNYRSVTLHSFEFKAEIADNYEKRKKGLGGRNGLCQNCAMLFEFPTKGKYSFWMKDMEFPLDIIWISNGKIVHMEKNIKSDFQNILNPEKEADMVLEINAGKADSMGLQIGDEVGL